MLGPPLKSPLKKLCFGGSGISLGEKRFPIISGIISFMADEMVNFWISAGDVKYIPWPLVLKESVRAILEKKKFLSIHQTNKNSRQSLGIFGV